MDTVFFFSSSHVYVRLSLTEDNKKRNTNQIKNDKKIILFCIHINGLTLSVNEINFQLVNLLNYDQS